MHEPLFVYFLNTSIESYEDLLKYSKIHPPLKGQPITPETFERGHKHIEAVREAIERAISGFQNQEFETLQPHLDCINCYAGCIRHELSFDKEGRKIIHISHVVGTPGEDLGLRLSEICRDFIHFVWKEGLDKVRRCNRKGCGVYFTKVGRGKYKKVYCSAKCARMDYESSPERRAQKRKLARERRKR